MLIIDQCSQHRRQAPRASGSTALIITAMALPKKWSRRSIVCWAAGSSLAFASVNSFKPFLPTYPGIILFKGWTRDDLFYTTNVTTIA